MNESEVISMVKEGRVFDLSPKSFEGRRMTIPEVEAIFGSFDAFWQYKGEPRPEKPHALLKSGMHSNGFIMCKAVLDYPGLCMIFAHEMYKAITEKMSAEVLKKIGFVASSAYSALDLGYCLSWLLSQEYNRKVKRIMAEKDDKGNPTIIRGGIDSNLIGLVINELMTTASGSTLETKVAVLKCNGDNPAPVVMDLSFVLMHRSRDLQLADGSTVVPVFHFDIENFDVPKGKPCPYCEAGSEAIKPKNGNNWQRLHGLA